MPNRCTIAVRVNTRGGLVSEIYTADEDQPQDAMSIALCWELMSVILKDQP